MAKRGLKLNIFEQLDLKPFEISPFKYKNLFGDWKTKYRDIAANKHYIK